MARKITWDEIVVYTVSTSVLWYTFSPLSALFFGIIMIVSDNIVLAAVGSYILWMPILAFLVWWCKKFRNRVETA